MVQKESAVAERKHCRFSFIVVELEDTSNEPSNQYILKLDRDVNGYNFIGDQIRDGETPEKTANRALRESINSSSLQSNWNVLSKDEVPEGEWEGISSSILPLQKPQSHYFLPYLSGRSLPQSERCERLAVLYLYKLSVGPESCPKLYANLASLAKCNVPFLHQESVPLCKTFTPADLVTEAWSNQDNPFIRFVFKHDILPFPKKELIAAPYLLHPPALEYCIEQKLTNLLRDNLSHGHEDVDGALDVTMLCPGNDEVSFCLRTNRTLSASIEVRWSGGVKVARITFPYPFQGVFILHSDTSLDGHAGKWIWHPRLVGKPGLWKLRKHSSKQGKRIYQEYLRLVPKGTLHADFPLDFSSDVPLNQDKEKSLITHCKKWDLHLGSDQWKSGRKLLSEYIETIIRAEAFDDQDLAWQRLYTYSSFLIERIQGFFAENKMIQPRDEKAPTVLSQWETLCRKTSTLKLIPTSDYINSGWLHFFDPLNSLDALAKLTSLQRYPYPKDALDQLPAIFRQNHPSYQGIICPVETPESEKVGITLHLARGVRTDAQGQLYSQENGHAEVDGDLGYGASLVPFYQHNDGPRSMMGAKNLKQAVPVKASATPCIKTGHEDTVQRIVSPHRNIGITPPCNEAAPGVDLLVAYMPWYGWNMEDAIVVNQELVDKGLLDWETIEERSAYILPEYSPAAPVFQNPFAEAIKFLIYDENGLRKKGRINPGDALIYFKHSDSGEVSPFPFTDDHEGELIDIKFTEPPSTLLGGSLHWSVRRLFPLMVGDKLMGRHGNKGVVSLISDPDELPRLPRDKSLPVDLRGRAVDLILNPHGVISRMNLGQLIETSVGLLARLNDSCFPENVGRAFNSIDWQCFQRAVHKFNGKSKKPLLDEYGRMFLTLPGGKRTEAPVVIGYQHIVRLKHVAAKKANVRGRAGTVSQLPYNVITGQPVGGKKRKGGQRVGEMEIWALAANQARANLESVLTLKSDPAVSSKNPLTQGQTFQSIKDHLLAMGVDLQQTGDESIRFGWLSSQTIQQLGREVATPDMWDPGLEGSYHCPNAKCKYHLPRMRTIGKSQRGGKTRATVQDVLRSHGYQLVQEPKNMPIPSGITREDVGEVQWDLKPLPETLDQRKKTVTFQYSRTNRTVSIAFRIGKNSHSAYKQKSPEHELSCREVAEFWLTCPKHSSSYLTCDNVRQKLFASPGGLCDENIFGPVSVSGWDPNSWGYIKLPHPVPYPKTAPFTFGKNDPPPPLLDCLPVLPLKYRFRGFTKIGTAIVPQPEQLTDLYREIITLARNKGSSRSLAKAVEKLFTLLHGRLFGKFGLLRRASLGRRVDASGRLVIVPDPTLPWDACGVPTEVLIPLLGPRIIDHPEVLRDFVHNPAADKLIEAIFSMDLSIPESISELVMSEDFWTATPWCDTRIAEAHLELAHSIISRYLEKFPNTTVILNRQPSLHRYSIMSFRPIPLPPGNGFAMKINPLVCKAFGADFDGDEMAIHLPWSDEEQKESVELMLPTHKWNLISVADNKPLANFTQDFIAGHFLLSRCDQAKKELERLVGELSKSPTTCPECSKLMSKTPPWKQEHGSALLSHICARHAEHAAKIIPQWMHLALKVITEHGLSFGFPELKKLQQGYKEETEQLLTTISSEPVISKLTETTKSLGDMVLSNLEDLTRQKPDVPGHGFATLAVSGARGDKQVRQIVSARGFLAPGDTGFELAPESFFIRESLVEGMTPSSSFMAAMNARSSMLDKKLGTGKAGALTRSLVLAGWEWTVDQGDCGVSGRRELTKCLWQKDRRICSACYGKILGYDEIPQGYPAGLIAAQSFGERGTQLSMQSFHTAEKQLSMDEIISLLNGKDYQVSQPGGIKSAKSAYNWFVERNDAQQFVERIQGIKSYQDLDRRHLLLIWLIIHRSKGKALAHVWKENRSAIAGLIGPNQWTCLLGAIRESREDDLRSPFVRIMTSRVPGNMA